MATKPLAQQKPFPFTDAHPRFRVPGWSELLGPDELMEPTDMVRHFLATGETGCGKSHSAIMRLLEAILRYPEPGPYSVYRQAVGAAAEAASDLQPAVFVVDPKQELGELVEREAAGRRVTRIAYGESGPILHLFEGKPLDQLDPFEAMDFILLQSDFFTQDQASTREPIWNMQAASIIKDMVAIDMWLAKKSTHLVEELWDQTRTGLERYEELKSVVSHIRYNPYNYFKPMSTVLGLSGTDDGSMALSCYLTAAEKLNVPGELTVRIIAMAGLCHNTRSGVIWMVNGILEDLAAEELAACVSLNPIQAPPKNRLLSVEEALNRGDVVIYVPTTSPIADMAGRCLKSKFFEFAFKRENHVRPFFYVVDEAHRFLTAGAQDGEQSLLDRCRAFRTGVVLSTQSMASMSYRLEGSAGGGFNALQIILNNCGNALYFRTTDIQTQESLRQRIPDPPAQNRPHVVRVRPLPTLGVGNCYALRSNGNWGLFQVHLPKE